MSKVVKLFQAIEFSNHFKLYLQNKIAIPQLSCLLYFHEFSRHNSHFRFSPQKKFCAHSFINFLETLALCRIILVASSVFTSFSVFIALCVKCDGWPQKKFRGLSTFLRLKEGLCILLDRFSKFLLDDKNSLPKIFLL